MSTVAWKLKDHVIKDAKLSEQKFKDSEAAASDYKVILRPMVVRKVPREVHTVPQRVVNGYFNSRTFLYSTNEQIMDTVSGWVPHHQFPSNYMDKPVSAKQLKAIGDIIAFHGLAFDRKVHKSLSKIKLAIQAGKSANDAEVEFKAKIAFGNDYIVVGSKRFPCAADGRVKVGNQKLRVAVLRALLEAGNIPSSLL
jgi:hypothetical protein